MLDHGYAFEKIEDEIEAIEHLDAEEQSALWVWAWTFDDMGRQRYTARRAHTASRARTDCLDRAASVLEQS